MDTNLSVWGYYNKDFVDPLYVPYQNTMMNTPDGVCPVNTWANMGSPMMVNPGLVRKGWGLSFQRKHGMDPCPIGFTPGDDGWCFPTEPEFEPQLYTENAFIPKNQYWSAYGYNGCKDTFNSFDFKSVSPYTGNFTTKIHSSPNPLKSTYLTSPVKNSYLG